MAQQLLKDEHTHIHCQPMDISTYYVLINGDSQRISEEASDLSETPRSVLVAPKCTRLLASSIQVKQEQTTQLITAC